jgi:4-hydroxy-3-polyprenylbenzoate decarboxylase
MIFESLRQFVEALDQKGNLKKIDGAEWDLEMGALTELMWDAGGPALFFQNIKGYEGGAQVATNLFATRKRCLLALDMPEDLKEEEALERFDSNLAECRPIPPRVVKSGPVTENVITGEKVNLLQLPIPRWHELDGGRYIGTGCCVIQRDPEGDWVNVGTYRLQLHDAKTTGIFIGSSHQGGMIQKKYWERGQSCPVAVSLGPDPMLFLISSGGFGFPWGTSEYDIVGHMKRRPEDVMIDEYTGLPIPVQSEIVLVGEIPPPGVETRPEGPFGEFTGYYASGTRPEPVIRVKAVYHRNNPILLGSPPLMPKGPYGYSFALSVKKREIKRRLLTRGISDVLDDCTLSIPGVEVIKVKQKYPGHAAEIGTAALEVAGSRIVVVVDEDVDVRDPWQVLWAMGTRCDPENAVKVVAGCTTHTLDPGLPPEKRKNKDLTVSKLMIDACRPYSWAKEFPAVNRCSTELRQKTLNKWKQLFDGYEVKA